MSADPSILHPSVREALDAASIRYEAVECRAEWADTVEFCANYGIPIEEACNTIVVALKTTPRKYVVCLVRSDTKLDVNHRLAKEPKPSRKARFRFPPEPGGRLCGWLLLARLSPVLPAAPLEYSILGRKSYPKPATRPRR